MKIFFVLLAISIFSSGAIADKLYCRSDSLTEKFKEMSGTYSHGTGFTDSIAAKCVLNSDRFVEGVWATAIETKIIGKGLSLYFTGVDAFKLVCPFRSVAELRGRKFYGFKTSAVIVPLGVSAGLFYNDSDTCILYGAQVGLGASVVGATLEFN